MKRLLIIALILSMLSMGPVIGAVGEAYHSDFPVMMNDMSIDGAGLPRESVFGKDISPFMVEEIIYLDSVDGATEDAWDVSESRDGSVLAWMDGGKLNIGGRGGVSAPQNAIRMFAGFIHLKAIHFNGCFDFSGTENASGLFFKCMTLDALDLENLNTSSVTDMSFMFSGTGFETIDLACLDTSSVVDMSGMFDSCINLREVSPTVMDSSRVKSMAGMFSNCQKLTNLNLSGMDTSSVDNMECMFGLCLGLETLDVSGMDTSAVTSMSAMFNECRSLKTLDVSGFDTSGVSKMDHMFQGCRALQQLDVSSFNTAQVDDMRGMFENCEALKQLDLTGFVFSDHVNTEKMFENCGAEILK